MRPVAAIAAVVAGAQLIAAVIGRDYWFDEVYMLAIGRSHLDWGSADQPPLVPALAALADMMFPGSLVVLRIPAIVATTAAVVVAAMIAREMGGDRRAQIVVAAVRATGFWVAVGGHWLTPYTLEPVGWLLVSWLLVRWIRVRDDRLLLVLGAVAGVAAMTKFQVLLLCAVLIAAVLAVGPRELLRRPMLWGGAGIGALVCAPTLWWQARHGWPQLQMSQVVAAEAGPLYGGRGGIAVQLVVAAGVLGVALAGYGLIRLVRDPALRDYRFLGLTLVVLYVVFVMTAGRPQLPMWVVRAGRGHRSGCAATPPGGGYDPVELGGTARLRAERGGSDRRAGPGCHADQIRCRRTDRAAHRTDLRRACAGGARPHRHHR